MKSPNLSSAKIAIGTVTGLIIGVISTGTVFVLFADQPIQSLASLVLGFLVNLVTGIWIAYWQFQASSASYIVKMTGQATKEIAEDEKNRIEGEHSYRSSLRNRFRYSLGVIVDELIQNFITPNWETIEQKGPWPRLISTEDRWELFNDHVRPIIQDLNSYSFLGWFWFPIISRFLFFQDKHLLKRLATLTELCRQLEAVVSELDAAFEDKIVELDDSKRVVPVDGKEENTKALREKYQELHKTWLEWLKRNIEENELNELQRLQQMP